MTAYRTKTGKVSENFMKIEISGEIQLQDVPQEMIQKAFFYLNQYGNAFIFKMMDGTWEVESFIKT